MPIDVFPRPSLALAIACKKSGLESRNRSRKSSSAVATPLIEDGH